MNDCDGVMHALSDGHRRQILSDLRDEEHIQPFLEDGDGRNRAIQLHHLHLPLLEENHLVAWDRETDIVRRGEDFGAVEPILTVLETQFDVLADDVLPQAGRTC